MLVQTSSQSTITNPSNLLPVVRELPADLETPVSIYLKLAGEGPSFLLESVTGGEQVARYSFIGIQASQAYVLRPCCLEKHTSQGIQELALPAGCDPLSVLKDELTAYSPIHVPGLPRFSGGLVGFLSYDLVRFFEPSVPLQPHADLPEGIFMLADTLVAFDHAYGRLLLIANVNLEDGERQARETAEARLDAIQKKLESPNALPSATYKLPEPGKKLPHSKTGATGLRSNLSQEQFEQAVLEAKEHIAAGDIFQVVLSQRLERETDASPFDIYRALRRLNPSPYMYFFDFHTLAGEPDFHLIGASPEMHVRLEGRKAAIRPIAGTRPRGQSPAEDAALEKELLADPKECAEHVMLVDLARNDLGRVCQYGSVRVTEQMAVERYSHVMHIVSHVEGNLRPEYDAFDLLRATFPAGTVSGAPKIRAMQIIQELEGSSRGPYAGAVGYFSFDGSSDTCITIRTLSMRGKTVSVQAGAGIVADSIPQNEYQESLNKARALAVAIEMAEASKRKGQP